MEKNICAQTCVIPKQDISSNHPTLLFVIFFSESTKEEYGYPYLAWGGETVAHARAQEDCWPKILHFLRKHLQQDTKSEE